MLAPMLAPVFEPLRAYAQESSKSNSLTITKIEPNLMRIRPPPARGGGGGGGERRKSLRAH